MPDNNRSHSDSPIELREVPLIVDLDGTLLRTDLLWETALRYCKNSLLGPINILLWLSKGRAYLKRKLAEVVSINPNDLPYSPELLSFISKSRADGRKTILATASDSLLAEPIANHLGVFDGVIASDGKVNLKGKNKLAAIRKFLQEQQLNENSFSYAGDSNADLPVWQAAREKILVNPTPRRRNKLSGSVKFDHILDNQNPTSQIIFKALRVYQWPKNLLIALPIFLAHEYDNFGKIVLVILGMISFCLCASGVYVLNDICDLESDRKHPEKKFRPFASGELPITLGIRLVPGLIGVAFLLALVTHAAFAYPLLWYLIATTLYSLQVKRWLVADVVLLSCLYTLRIMAGGIAADVPISEWMLSFSIFFFLSLALAKRYAELKNASQKDDATISGRGYLASDMTQVGMIGCASGVISVLILALYINSNIIRRLYSDPQSLWLLCPIFLYWITRFWILAGRGLFTEDPLLVALKDKASYAVGALALLIVLWAR